MNPIGRRVVPLGRLRAHLDGPGVRVHDRPGLHTDCIDRDLHRAEIARRVSAEQRAAGVARQLRQVLLALDAGALKWIRDDAETLTITDRWRVTARDAGQDPTANTA